MFRNIVSNLSLTPSAGSQLTFYLRRLQGEKITRTLSMVMAVGLFGLQITTLVAPPENVNASSSNDVIQGGIETSHPQATLLHHFDNTPGIQELFNKFGINRTDIGKTKHGTLNSKNHNLKSIGRNHHFAQDQKFTVAGQTYYVRPLYLWGDNLTYKVLEGRRHGDDRYFAIMYDCGNLVITDLTPEVVNTPTTPTKAVLPPPPPPRPTPQPAAKPTPTPAQPQPTPVAPTPPPVVTTPPPPPPVTPTEATIKQSKTGLILSTDGSTKDANNATAQPGDIIEYTLTTKNTGNGAKKDYQVTESINDILEYADLINPGAAKLDNGELIWPKNTIDPGVSYIVLFQVKVKSPIPTTPSPVSDPQSFDLKLDNVYGNLVRVNLYPPTAAKQVEVASSNLPQTGPETSILMFVFIAVIAYFYFRNRQLVKELSIIRHSEVA